MSIEHFSLRTFFFSSFLSFCFLPSLLLSLLSYPSTIHPSIHPSSQPPTHLPTHTFPYPSMYPPALLPTTYSATYPSIHFHPPAHPSSPRSTHPRSFVSTNLLVPSVLGRITEPGLSAAYSLLLTQLESHALEQDLKHSMFDSAHYAQEEARLGRWRQEGTESLVKW